MFTLLGLEGCAALEAVVMDMNGAFEQELRAWAPQTQIVYDLFHVVAKYGREVIDRVRVDEANRCPDDRLRAQGRFEGAVELPPRGLCPALLARLIPSRDVLPHRTAEGLCAKATRLPAGLLAHCRYPLRTSVLEGIKNKIKVIKRMAYGFRHDQYFLPKIRAAFPGIG